MYFKCPQAKQRELHGLIFMVLRSKSLYEVRPLLRSDTKLQDIARIGRLYCVAHKSLVGHPLVVPL